MLVLPLFYLLNSINKALTLFLDQETYLAKGSRAFDMFLGIYRIVDERIEDVLVLGEL
jgi:hypothetical protein